MDSFPRRALLRLTLGLSGLLTLGGLLKFLGYRPASVSPTAFTLDAPSSYPVGSATYFADARAWLLRDANGLYAISVICPHLGCTVDRRPDGFLCPCHGSRFLPEGDVVNGPAARPLSFLALSPSPKNRLILHTDRPASPSDRLP